MRQRALLIYDGNCGPCQRGATWISSHLARPAVLDLVASQDLSDDALTVFGLDRQTVEESLCWVGDEGAHVGSEAVVLALAKMRRPWSFLAPLMRAPLVSSLLARSYPVIARNRHRWPGSKTCGLNLASQPQSAQPANEVS